GLRRGCCALCAERRRGCVRRPDLGAARPTGAAATARRARPGTRGRRARLAQVARRAPARLRSGARLTSRLQPARKRIEDAPASGEACSAGGSERRLDVLGRERWAREQGLRPAGVLGQRPLLRVEPRVDRCREASLALEPLAPRGEAPRKLSREVACCSL